MLESYPTGRRNLNSEIGFSSSDSYNKVGSGALNLSVVDSLSLVLHNTVWLSEKECKTCVYCERHKVRTKLIPLSSIYSKICLLIYVLHTCSDTYMYYVAVVCLSVCLSICLSFYYHFLYHLVIATMKSKHLYKFNLKKIKR